MFYLADIGGNQALDAFYLLIMGVFVFFMQVRGAPKARAETQYSPPDRPRSAIIWWAWGMGVAYGDSGTEDGNVFIGTAVG
uniref:Uncharacterized protein n=2 Tax=Emiliania huxleyi TaxID=2903 RepID=A0A0D3J635_EMIH1